MMRRAVSVRARLQGALAALALATLVVGAVSWFTLDQGNARLEELHDGTLVRVDRALVLTGQASDLATLAPFLLTLDSPFRIRREGDNALRLVQAIAAGLEPGAGLTPVLADVAAAIAELVAATDARAGLRDQVLRLNAQLARDERRFAGLSAAGGSDLSDRAAWITLQRIAAALLAAGRAENLIGVGEFQREFHGLSRRMAAAPPQDRTGRDDLMRLMALAEGPQGLFELRRQELSRQIGAEAALVRIRRGTEAVIAHAANVSAGAQRDIAAERTRTTSALALAKSTIVLVVLASAFVAVLAALFVRGYVTGSLGAVSDAMMRLAGGDRSSRLPRGEGAGDEIGTLFHAFRTFRANALRLDRSNRQLAQKNALFERMFAGMSDGVAVLSEGGAIVAQNARLADVLRCDPSRLRGRPVMAEILAACGWAGGTGAQDYARLTRSDGLILERRAGQLPGGGAVMLFSDATERHRMDDRLRQLQRIEALGKVAGEVAHDFGNILSTISGSLHLLETAPPDRARGLRAAIGGAVDLGASLTQRLLAFARRQHLEPERVELNALVAGVADLVALTLRDDIALTITPAPCDLPVLVDAGQLESAILNLCLNAGQATAGPGRIEIRLSALPGAQAMLEVIDTGCGMAPEVLRHAMEPFFTARRDGTGTGLGLAMVYGFIRQSGGEVQIASEVGQGTTVRLILPCLTANAADAPLPWARVLLVEDDPGDMARATAILTAGGAAVQGCATQGEACALLADAPLPDLLLTDLHLGGAVAGWDLAARALDAHPDLRVIVASGRMPDANPLAARHAARVVCLAKPLTPAALAAAGRSLHA